MNSLKILIIFILGCSTTIPSQIVSGSPTEEEAGKTKLTIFYESLCPDCKVFFINQLVPTYSKLWPFIEPVLLPFGNAKVVNETLIKCQHGPKECAGNRLMACVQDRGTKGATGGWLDVMHTLDCLFKGNQAKQCVETHLSPVPFEDVKSCSESQESFDMMVKFAGQSKEINYVPWINVNDLHSAQIQKECEFGLFNCLCKRLEGSSAVKQVCSEQS